MTGKGPVGGYQVGYGRPPAHTRFKAGASGNPKGRPRKDVAERNATQILSDPILVRIGDRQAVLQPLEIALRKTIRDALQGKDRPLVQICRMLVKHRLVPPPVPPATSGVVVIPTSMPMAMGMRALALFGPPPWTSNQIAKARTAYLAARTVEERTMDEAIGYSDL